MPKFSLSVPHELGQQEAQARLQAKLAKALEKFSGQVSDLQVDWLDNLLNFAFSTYGMKFKGAMKVEDSAVQVDGDLPFAAMMFKGKIESELRSSLERWLS